MSISTKERIERAWGFNLDKDDAITLDVPLRLLCWSVGDSRRTTWPRHLDRRTLDGLAQVGCVTVGDLSNITAAELFAIPRLGHKSAKMLLKAAQRAGVKVPDSSRTEDAKPVAVQVGGPIAQEARRLVASYLWIGVTDLIRFAVARAEAEVIAAMREHVQHVRESELDKVREQIRELEAKAQALEAA